MTERLNNDFFRALAQKLPGFKAQYAQKAGEKKAQSNGDRIPQPPCQICGKRFGSKKKEFALTQQKIKTACPSCVELLESGHTAAVTSDGKRFAFIKWPEIGDLAGRIQLVSDVTMDAIEAQNAKGN